MPAGRAARWLLFVTLCLTLFAGASVAAAQRVETEYPPLSEEEIARLTEVRRSYLRQWHELGDQGLPGVERFARTVQLVVDIRFEGPGHEGREPVRLILDDLVDLFVAESLSLERRLAMSTPSVLGKDALAEADEDLSGFAPGFRDGEGRYRHFALNAALSYRAPDAVVELLAKLRGRDLFGSSPDSIADRATNRLGREFTRFLSSSSEEQLKGKGVYDWLIERFGEESAL